MEDEMNLEKTVTGDDLEAADISDHIAEAYFGAMGESMREKSMKRIDWICDQVKGPRALDIGCSQGITEILLGRRQIHVLGVDIAAEAIAYAERMLADEPAEVQQYIRFLHSDFLKADLPDTGFDTLILSEILEHLYDPEEMLKKAIAHVRNGGCVVITVPFGINDFPDHKQTFYVLGILEILEKYAKVEHIEFMGSWIGFVAYKQEAEDGENAQEISYSLLRREEEAFFLIERALRDDGKSLRGKLDITTDKFKRAAENYETAKQWLADEKDKSQRLSENYETAKQWLADEKDKSQRLSENYETAKQWLADEKDKSQRLSENYETAKQWLADEKEKSQRLSENYETAKQWLADEKEKSRRAAENYETAKQWLADEKEKSAAALKRAAADYDALESCYNTEKEERAAAEMKFMQLEFYLQQREEESLGLQRSLTQRIVKTEKDLRMSAKRVQDAEEKLKTSEEKLETADKKLKSTGEKLKSTEEKLRTADEKLKSADEKLKSADEKLKSTEAKLKNAEEKLRTAEKKLRTAEEKLKSTEEKLKTTDKKLKSTGEKLKEKTLPPIWYTMAGSRVGRMLCKLFGWYHNSKRIFRRQKRQSNSK